MVLLPILKAVKLHHVYTLVYTVKGFVALNWSKLQLSEITHICKVDTTLIIYT